MWRVRTYFPGTSTVCDDHWFFTEAEAVAWAEWSAKQGLRVVLTPERCHDCGEAAPEIPGGQEG
jgi:hypothetical protein